MNPSFIETRLVKILADTLRIITITIFSLLSTAVAAQTITSNQTGTHNGFYYSFWKDSGDATFGLREGGRYTSQWGPSTNNWVGGKGWNPGGARVVRYSGSYNVDNSQNSYLALYGWTTNPLVEYYVIESYGSYNPSSCNGGTNYGSFQSDGATYSVRRCQRVNQPSIEGTATFYQYFSVRTPKKGFGSIAGTITVQNHFNYWASQGLNLGSHNYMVVATEGYQSQGSSDITVSEGSSNGGSGGNTGGSGSDINNSPSNTNIVVRASGSNGDEHINLLISGNVVASWNLSTSAQNYIYSGSVGGDLQVEFDNDADERDVELDWVFVNGETREAEDMEYNTANYDGECGGGSYSQTMHCNGVIGFGGTGNCFTGACNNTAPSGSDDNGSSGGNSGDDNIDPGDIVVRARGTNGDETIRLVVGGDIVQTWTLSTSAQNYAYSGNAIGDIRVEFTNDGNGRDVILDFAIVNGQTRQAEDMNYNTATYGNGECGGGQFSETMHCNGAIGFGSTSGATGDGSGSSGGSGSSAACQCNWYGSTYPLCQNSMGWGWENNQSCVDESTCSNQWGDGGVICN